MTSSGLAILFSLAYEVTTSPLAVVGLVIAGVGATAMLIIVLYALIRRVSSLRRGPRLQDDREERGFVLEWLR